MGENASPVPASESAEALAPPAPQPQPPASVFASRAPLRARVLLLQRQAGNAAVVRMLQRSVEEEGEPGRRPNLDIGDSGPGVTLLQRLLGAAQTGVFDAQTRRAVDRFQRQQGWEPSGVGPGTWDRIDNHAGEPGRRPNLVEGDRGPGVALLQRLLGVAETGYFGPATRKAVDAFQRAQGWEPSGVGPMTWEALDNGVQQPQATTASSGPLTVGGVQILDQANIDIGGAGFAAAGMVPLLSGGTQLASGTATLGATPVAGGAEVRAIKVAVDVGKDVISKSPQLWREARALQAAAQAGRTVVQGGQVAAEAAPVVATEGAAIGVAGTLAVVGLVWLAEAAVILVLNEAFLSAGRPRKEELPQAGPPDPAQAPGAPVPAPVTDPNAVNPALAPGTDGAGPALAPGKDPQTPAVAPGVSDEELKLKVPDPVPVTRPQQNWWPEISAVAPDWGQKGAHIKINDIELAVRPAGPGIVFPPVFSRDVGTEDTAGAQRAANDAIHELGFRQRLYNACVRAIQLLRKGSQMDRARSGELRHLLRELEALGLK
jgi:peptidoglycan hydrolase-like protein with peptidoglycan-binding domain